MEGEDFLVRLGLGQPLNLSGLLFPHLKTTIMLLERKRERKEGKGEREKKKKERQKKEKRTRP